eukprot:10641023-Ditylum_brightwellii.AAC.1
MSEPKTIRQLDGVSPATALNSSNPPMKSWGKSKSTPPSPSKTSSHSILHKVEQHGSALLSRRPDQISVSLIRLSADTGIDLGVQFSRMVVADSIVVAGGSSFKGMQQHGTLSQVNPSSLRKGSQHSQTYFQTGDVVEFVNDIDCRPGKRVLGLRKITQAACSANRKMITTIAVSTRSMSADVNEPVRLCQAVALLKGTLDSCTTSPLYHQTITSGIVFGQQEDGLLIIKSISGTGWLVEKGCAIQKGDIVIAINENSCAMMDPSDANVLLHAVVSITPHMISITTIAANRCSKESKINWDNVRKAAVAMGGGTMVSAGAILMVTPLHPIGHAMAIGGVGVLGTEFELPRKAVSSAKRRWDQKRGNKIERDEEEERGLGDKMHNGHKT